jgi:nucleotide-binding universal stress UspA family protein
MTMLTEFAAAATFKRDEIFRRVLVGVDDSPESLEAARQAAKLATGRVRLLAACEPHYTVTGGGMAPAPALVRDDEQPIQERAEAALEQAKREVAPIEPAGKVVRGRAWEQLIWEMVHDDSTLVAVGSHGAGRAKGIAIGSTATELVHKARCSVLVARKPLKEFPSSIVVGVDNSFEGAAADAVAGELAERFDASLERFENVPRPVHTLVDAAIEADLLVVGSRGLHGIKALGSVSERVAHEARCSVLIVR